MVSELARGDYEDLCAAGLSPTLDDFDRLNQLAERITNGGETTAANYPRVGWAGDVPFFQPTIAAFTWYLEFAERATDSVAERNACWFYALAHARDAAAFAALVVPKDVITAVNAWYRSLPVTTDEIERAARFASVGYDDAKPGKTAAQQEADAALTDDERRERSLANLSAKVSDAAAATSIAPTALGGETISRLDAMIDAVKALEGKPFGPTKSRLQADYDLALREIRKRLTAEKSDSPACNECASHQKG